MYFLDTTIANTNALAIPQSFFMLAGESGAYIPIHQRYKMIDW